MRFTFLPYRSSVSGLTPTIDKLGEGQPAINIPDRRMWIAVNNKIVEVTTIHQLIDLWIKVIDIQKERSVEYEAQPPIKRIKASIKASWIRFLNQRS